MKMTIVGTLLDVNSKEWEMEGKKGVSHKLHIKTLDGKYENVVIPGEMVQAYKDKIFESIEVETDLFVKGTYSLKISK